MQLAVEVVFDDRDTRARQHRYEIALGLGRRQAAGRIVKVGHQHGRREPLLADRAADGVDVDAAARMIWYLDNLEPEVLDGLQHAEVFGDSTRIVSPDLHSTPSDSVTASMVPPVMTMSSGLVAAPASTARRATCLRSS